MGHYLRVIALSFSLLTAQSYAAVVTTTLSGEVGFVGFGPTTGFQTGNAVTLSFTYDTATTSVLNGSGTQRSYSPGDNGALLSMSLQIVSNTLGTWNAQTTGGNFGTTKINAGSFGQLQLTSQIAPSPFFTFDTGTPLAPFSFKLDANEAVIGDQIDGALNAPSSFNLADWNQTKGTLYFDNGARAVELNFTSQVPEPSSSFLLGLAMTMGMLRRRR